MSRLKHWLESVPTPVLALVTGLLALAVIGIWYAWAAEQPTPVGADSGNLPLVSPTPQMTTPPVPTYPPPLRASTVPPAWVYQQQHVVVIPPPRPRQRHHRHHHQAPPTPTPDPTPTHTPTPTPTTPSPTPTTPTPTPTSTGTST